VSGNLSTYEVDDLRRYVSFKKSNFACGETNMATYVPAIIWIISAIVCYYIAKVRKVKPKKIIDTNFLIILALFFSTISGVFAFLPGIRMLVGAFRGYPYKLLVLGQQCGAGKPL